MNFARGGSLLALSLGLMPVVARGWTGNGAAPGTDGYSVDTSQRNDVVSFWQSVYKASEGYQKRVAWTGSYSVAAGAEGTTAAAFVNDVERRANFIRALCGLPANAQFNTGATLTIGSLDTYKPSGIKSAAAQRSALMIIETYLLNGTINGLSHAPDPSLCSAWTQLAWNANSKGNLSYGFYGPGAVDAYFREAVAGTAAENLAVGHRRWLLNIQATDFATGDIPGKNSEGSGGAAPPSNCLYVVPKTAELDTTAGARYVPYPAAGYFPAALNSPYWSLTYPGATFSALTTVKMVDANGTQVTTTDVNDPFQVVAIPSDNAPTNSIVWHVPKAVAATSVNVDTTYTVTVSNFYIPGNASPQTCTYSVTLINPEKVNDPMTVLGPATPPAAGTTNYTFVRPSYSDAVEVGYFKSMPASWTDGAEEASPKVIDRTTTDPVAMPLVSNLAKKSGTNSFHLTFPTAYDPVLNGTADQIFELDRDFLPTTGATMTFWYRRYMSASTTMYVETSSDGGLTWSIRGTLSPATETTFSSGVANLPTSGVQRIRFRLTCTAGSSIYTVGNTPSLKTTGVFIDDITFANCNWYEKEGSVLPSSSDYQVAFNSATAGQTLVPGDNWYLRMRAQYGGRWFPFGAPLAVVPAPPYPLTGPAAPPVAGATYSFTPEGVVDSYQLEVARVGTGTWTEGAEASPVPQVIDGTGSYALVSTKYKKTGTNSFRLGVDVATDALDTFTIDRNIVPTATSNLTFATHRGRMLKTNTIQAELSTDNGATWASIWSQPGLAATLTATTADPAAFIAQTVSLASYAGKTVRVRFAFHNDVGSAILSTLDTGTATGAVSGVWIDDVAVSNSITVSPVTVTSLPGSATYLRLNATTAGEALVAGASYRLRIRAVNAGVPGTWGQALTVVPTTTPALTGFNAWLTYDYPMLAAVAITADSDGDGIPNWLEYAFSLDPLTRNAGFVDVPVLDPNDSTLSITRALPVDRTDITYGAEWSNNLSTWSSSGVTVTKTGGQLKASVVAVSGKRFLRWKITKS